jgi:hypothetical protein
MAITTKTGTNPSSSSLFTLESAWGSSPLPVLFEKTGGQNVNNTNEIQWTVSSEQDIASYEVEEYNIPMQDFNTIGAVTANNSMDFSNYTFTDNSISETNIYRITAVSVSGQKMYSAPFTIYSKVNASDIHIYTATNNTELIDANTNDIGTLSIYNTNGQKVLLQNNILTSNKVSIDISALANGVYIAQLATSKGVVKQQIIR